MVDLTCPMTTEALKLDVHVQGDEFLDFKNFVVIYRVYFRLMSSNLNTRFLNPLPSNSQETILLQIEDNKPTVFTPKALKWEEITIPEVIELQEPTIPAQIERSDIEQITRRDRIENTDNFIEQREQLFVNTTTDRPIC